MLDRYIRYVYNISVDKSTNKTIMKSLSYVLYKFEGPEGPFFIYRKYARNNKTCDKQIGGKGFHYCTKII